MNEKAISREMRLRIGAVEWQSWCLIYSWETSDKGHAWSSQEAFQEKSSKRTLMCNFSGQEAEFRDAADFKDNGALSYPPELTISYMQKVPQLQIYKYKNRHSRRSCSGMQTRCGASPQCMVSAKCRCDRFRMLPQLRGHGGYWGWILGEDHIWYAVAIVCRPWWLGRIWKSWKG